MKLNDGPIAARWESFRRLLADDGAGPQQIEATRKAFYAGAMAAFAWMMSAADVPTAAAKQAAISQELMAFTVAVIQEDNGK